MEIKIAENLKTFRKAKGNTQEDLARHLNISVQAVSKWERGEGFPEISLLPAIAAYYSKSVDELLGCSEIEKAKKIEEYITQYNKNGSDGKVEENVQLMKTALKEFPNDLTLLFNLCHALLFSENPEYLDEGIAVGEEILSRSTDDNQRFATIHALVYAYNSKNDIAKAKQYAEKLPDFCSKNTALECILQGEELRELTQGNIALHIGLIDTSVAWMLRSKEYTPQEKIFAYETVDKLYHLFLYDGNYTAEHSSLYMLWRNIAEEYAKLQDSEHTISALKKAYHHAYQTDHFEQKRYTSLFADTIEYSEENFTRNFENSYVSLLESEMERQEFDFIRNTDEWNEIITL